MIIPDDYISMSDKDTLKTEEIIYKGDQGARSALEAILFAFGRMLSIRDLSVALEIPPGDVLKELLYLQEYLEAQGSGIRLKIYEKKYCQLCSAPESSIYIEKVRVDLGIKEQHRRNYSDRDIETLTIIASKQPVTLQEIIGIRHDENTRNSIKKLLDRGLIRELGRKKTQGNPVLYGTTPIFLREFDLSSLDELPDLDYKEIRKLKHEADHAEREKKYVDS